jgi:hypothetical protein
MGCYSRTALTRWIQYAPSIDMRLNDNKYAIAEQRVVVMYCLSYYRYLYARCPRIRRSCMVVVHAESFCGVRYQIPKCLTGNADKRIRTRPVESASTAL